MQYYSKTTAMRHKVTMTKHKTATKNAKCTMTYKTTPNNSNKYKKRQNNSSNTCVCSCFVSLSVLGSFSYVGG